MTLNPSDRPRATPSPCVIEPLEPRQLLSAAMVMAHLRPLGEWPAHSHHAHAIHVPVTTGPSLLVGAVKKPAVSAGPDILGGWAGTFTENVTRIESAGGVTFTVKRNQSFTGTFDVASIAGKSAVSTVTVVKNRQFLVVVKLGNRQQVSMAGSVTSDGSMIYGRYSVEGARNRWSTGVFAFRRVGK